MSARASGVEAVSALAHAHGGAIVVYTGDASESTRSAAIAAGARAVVIKGDGRLSESVEALREHAHADDLEEILAKRPPPKGCT